MDYAATVVLLNWHRQFNIPAICMALRQQSVRLRIVIWSNEAMPNPYWDFDEIICASANMVCWPRWFVGAQVETEYLICMDDDICPHHPDAIRHLLDCADRHKERNTIVGLEGVRLAPKFPYFPANPQIGFRQSEENLPDNMSIHFSNVPNDVAVDIVKGRLTVMQPKVLHDLPMLPLYYKWCDDIVVSAHVGAGRLRPHVIAPVPSGAFRDLAGKFGSMALTSQSFVREQREAARRHYFAHI